MLQLRDVIGRTNCRNVLTWNIVTSLNHITGATVRNNVHRSWLTSWNKIIGQDCWPSSSSSSPSDAATPLAPTFIFVSDHNFNIYIHPSIIDYSSAVDLVALRVNLVCKYRASRDTYRSTLQSLSFTDSGCYPSTEAGQILPLIYTLFRSWSMIITLHRAVFALRSFALHRGIAATLQRLCETFWLLI